jgi:hypothetical protein
MIVNSIPLVNVNAMNGQRKFKSLVIPVPPEDAGFSWNYKRL